MLQVNLSRQTKHKNRCENKGTKIYKYRHWNIKNIQQYQSLIHAPYYNSLYHWVQIYSSFFSSEPQRTQQFTFKPAWLLARWVGLPYQWPITSHFQCNQKTSPRVRSSLVAQRTEPASIAARLVGFHFSGCSTDPQGEPSESRTKDLVAPRTLRGEFSMWHTTTMPCCGWRISDSDYATRFAVRFETRRAVVVSSHA